MKTCDAWRPRLVGCGCVLAVGCALASMAAAGDATHGKSSSPAWGADVRIEGFHTSDLFPGGDTREPDWGTRVLLEPRWTARLGGPWRLRPWVRTIVERYQDWGDRDLVRWTVGADLKRGPHRLRLYGGWTRNELYFPSDIGDARLDRRNAGAELRIGLGAGLMAQVTGEVESEDFVPIYDERDDTRWTWRTSLERGFGDERRLRLTHVYRRSDTDSRLYSYEQNALRAEAGWSAARWTAGLEWEAALRNYRTGLGFAPNFARQDDRWRGRAVLGRTIVPALAAQGFGEWRRNDSTRDTKNYSVATYGLALAFSR